MNRLAAPLSFALVAALSACTTPPQTGGPSSAQQNIVTNVHAYTPGSGVVQSVTPTPAFTGASSTPMQRLEIRMDNGRTQYVDTASTDITRGTRVTLTEDRLIRRM